MDELFLGNTSGIHFDDWGDTLDVQKLLKTSLISFDESFVTDTVGTSFKTFRNERVPQEAAYQADVEKIYEVGFLTE